MAFAVPIFRAVGAPSVETVRRFILVLACGTGLACAASGPHNPVGIDWQPIPSGTGQPFSMARTETTVGQFQRFADATRLTTLAERQGGGQVYEAGWVKKPGWHWRTPFGGKSGGQQAAAADEPAVHITFDEAQAFCRWAGGHLPTDAQWLEAAYTERREAPPAPFTTSRTYPFPTGDNAAGAQCLDDCGPSAHSRAIQHGAHLLRGHGHARTGTTPAGVNGLYDMGANAWEWVDEPPGATGNAERRTRGGSWWYGSTQMRADDLQSKPADTTVVCIGFRCARQPSPPTCAPTDWHLMRSGRSVRGGQRPDRQGG